jgi:hypothetical protein
MESQSSTVTGWIVTQQAYAATNTSVSLKILNPGIESDIGICPTSPASGEPNGIYDQPNYYRYYISGANYQPPYTLLAYKKKGGTPETQVGDASVLPSPYGDGTTPFYIRMRFGDGMIYFEYSLDGCYWYIIHFETFDLPGYSTSSPFYYELAANNKIINGNPDIPDVDDFKIESYPAGYYTITSTILNDPLSSASFNSSANPGVNRKVYGGNFSGAGWKPNSSKPDGNEVADMMVYDLSRYIENGSLEIDVTKFDPNAQNNTNPNLVSPRHHVLAMFRVPWGGHHVVENVDTFWDLHTGSNYSGGVKFMSNTYYSCDEFATVIDGSQKPWNKTTTYRLKIVWDNRSLKYYRDGVCHTWHILQNSMQLRYIYIGRDSTVSGDFVTGFMNNQYPTMSDAEGPIYSNLVVKEFRLNETAPPVINSPAIVDLYQNAVRLSWSTSETAVCYVEYGTTTAYGQKTTILGPPPGPFAPFSFTTLLSNLNSGTLYHYRITAEDNAGNVAQSADLTFTTTTNGVYAFKPVADTYIEDDDREDRDNPNPDYPWLYGKTRAEGNYGWMNLMTALYRDSFLQFNVSGVGNIAQATLRLYGRQTSVTGANVRQFMPLQSNWEKNATWTDASKKLLLG